MYALIFWPGAEECSVVPLTDITKPKNCDIECGKEYPIKWGGTNWNGRVLRLSGKSSDLDKVVVTKTGAVLDFPDMSSKCELALSRKRDLKAGNRIASAQKDAVEHERQAKILQQSQLASDIRKTAMVPATMTSTTALVKEGSRSTTSQDIVPVNLNVINACKLILEEIEMFVKEKKEELSKIEAHGVTTAVTDERKQTPPSDKTLLTLPCFIRDADKVDLIENSGVYVSKVEKKRIGRSFCEDPNEMVRQLMSSLVGNLHLKGMTVRGSGNTRGIPSSILKAVQGFVSMYSTKILSDGEFSKVVSNHISSLRYPKKRKCEEPSKFEHSRAKEGTTQKTSKNGPSKKTADKPVSPDRYRRYDSASDYLLSKKDLTEQFDKHNEQKQQPTPDGQAAENNQKQPTAMDGQPAESVQQPTAVDGQPAESVQQQHTARDGQPAESNVGARPTVTANQLEHQQTVTDQPSRSSLPSHLYAPHYPTPYQPYYIPPYPQHYPEQYPPQYPPPYTPPPPYQRYDTSENPSFQAPPPYSQNDGAGSSHFTPL